MVQTAPVKIFIAVISIVLLAVAGYFIYIYSKDKNPTIVQTTEIPTVTPSPEPTFSSTPIPIPLTRMGYVQQQLILAGFNSIQIESLITDSRLKLYSIKQVAYKEPDWNTIKQKLYAPAFVQKGKDYIVAHQEVFDNAENNFGVPKEVIAGVIAIETEFGLSSGTTLTFNALYSRMEQWSEAKWKIQADQLVALSTYCLKSELDCFAIKGSYAGALGIVQFMPDSLLNYGIDGNKDGVVDLYNPVDAIPSAGNFLARHGWSTNNANALARYYGSSIGYPEIVLMYASLLTQ